ncbi:NUDIX domain-containing protein [Anaerosporobacter faecicola]|uniref:NUDIX domain-containing protein n=1 Tax=Anaerosporobacter faecicola TaxID=2718714 RepID=UPI00143CB19E|nr:NUDIX domain-containing protein [Anaerosporobacter faecicola]
MGKYRIIVKGIVKNLDKYLIVEKWFDDRIQDPYQWGFVDGEVNFGEAPDRAVVRVITENTGLCTQIDRILYTWSFMAGDTYTIGITYLCLTGMEDVVLSEELHNYKWITKEEFADYINNQDILKDLDNADVE